MLTETKLKSLKSTARPYRVADREGLSIEVSPKGTKTWIYRYRLNDRQIPVRLGRYPAVTLLEAREKRYEAERMVAHGKSPASEKKAAEAGLAADSTIEKFAGHFLEDVVRPVRKDTEQMERYLRHDVLPEIGYLPLSQVTPRDVLRITDTIKGRGSPMAALAVRSLIKRLYDYAIARQLTTFNPASSIPARSIARAKARDRVLSPRELQIYLTKLYASDVSRRYKLALHLILITLVRKSELVFARWADIDFEKGEWQIPAPNSKSGKPRLVYLSQPALGLLTELQALSGNSAYVVPSRNELKAPISKTTLNAALATITFGLPNFTIHDSRRTASTQLHEMGWKTDVIEKALGHEIGGVRGIYNRAEYAMDRRRMLEQWAAYVDDLLASAMLPGVRAIVA